jgi:hypothetical protein
VPAGLNLGRQLAYQKWRHPSLFAQAKRQAACFADFVSPRYFLKNGTSFYGFRSMSDCGPHRWLGCLVFAFGQGGQL